MTDNRTQMISAPPTLDPNKTIMGTAPTLNATMTIKPVQCPICKSMNPPGVMFCVDCGLIFDRALPGDAFGAPTVQFPVLVDSTGKEYVLRPGATVFGRQGDVVLDDPGISRRHAQVTNTNGTLTVEDLGSTNGTKLNGTALSAPTAAQNGDEITLGGVSLKVSLPGEANKTQVVNTNKTQAIPTAPTVQSAIAWLVTGETRHSLEQGINTFGRRDTNTIQLSDPFISGKHGEVEVTADGIYLTDIGSTNGTLLNGGPITANQRIKMSEGDVIKLGDLELTLETKK